MRIQDLPEEYRVGFRHNPKHFYPNSFRVEHEAGRMILVGRVKRHVKKNYRVVGIVKRRKGRR